MYWEITPHTDNDYDSCVMPADTDPQHHEALEYAQDVLEHVWDDIEPGQTATVTIALREGRVPCENS